MDIKELYQKRAELNSLIEKTAKEQDVAIVAQIKSLNWIKDTCASYDTSTFYSAGIPHYQLKLLNYTPPKLYSDSPIVLVDNNDYYKNIVLYTNINSFMSDYRLSIATYDVNSFLDFLRTYKFKSLSYRKQDADILSLLHSLYNSGEQS